MNESTDTAHDYLQAQGVTNSNIDIALNATNNYVTPGGSSSTDASLVVGDGVTPILNPSGSDQHESIGLYLDRQWAKEAFLIGDSCFNNKYDIANRYWTSASTKFTDTTLGGNFGINAKPQFTRYSDVRVPGRLTGRTEVSPTNTSGAHGMGRYYSEAIDDPSQVIYMRFGVPQFNSLSNFMARAFDPDLISLARTGRGTSAWYDLASGAGSVTAMFAFPMIAIPIAAGKALLGAFGRPTSKFYTLKPTMHNYWGAVNNIVNTIAINKGIFPKKDNSQKIGEPFGLDEEYQKALSELMPDIFKDTSFFDVYKLANKGQRLRNEQEAALNKASNEGSDSDYVGFVQKSMSDGGTHTTPVVDRGTGKNLADRIKELVGMGGYKYYKSESSESALETDPRLNPDGSEKSGNWFSQFITDFSADIRDGSQFAVFKVDSTGPVSESFSNSVVESDLSNKLNGTSSQIREARFAFAEGNLVGGIVGDTVGSILGAAKDVVMGGINGATFGFGGLIAGLGGSGFIEIPKHWQSSTANLAKSNYSMQLISPYGNPFSQMMNIYIPLSMILAGCLPISTGKQSHTSPFICQLYDRGRNQIQLGMIESLSISRGVSHLPFNTKGNAMALDVSFTVVDLSPVMAMPLGTGLLETAIKGGLPALLTIDEEQTISGYLAVLAGQDMYSQLYSSGKRKMNIAKRAMAKNTLTSPAYMSLLASEVATGATLGYNTGGSTNILELFTGAITGPQ